MGYSGAGGNGFMKKTRIRKSRDTVPVTSLVDPYFNNCPNSDCGPLLLHWTITAK